MVEAGTKELLVISQDTSAYGVDIRHQPRMWHGEEVRAHMTDFARKNHSHPPDNSAHQHQAQR